ncbi:ATP-binding protein [Bernardetia sp. Wsw4-3y2]|uniref:AAA family ATPase n=1 Tax=Bernardetia sp. Wsw4-3y2 TaxID=3127471 RepID=UPI0030CFEFD8
MLIRFIVENTFSFGEKKEFTTICSNNHIKTLKHHKYNFDGLNLLKLSSIYGANGAGKSNLIKALALFQDFVVNQKMTYTLKQSAFKFNPKSTPQSLAIEFIEQDTPFYYGIEFIGDIILSEELYISGLGNKDDKLIFHRTTDKDKNIEMIFLDEFENDEKSQILKSVLIDDKLIKHNETALKILANRENRFLQDIKKAYNWFEFTLQIITPDSRPTALAHTIETDEKFGRYVEDIICSLNLGISSLKTEKIDIHEFFGKDNPDDLERILELIDLSPSNAVGARKEMKGAETIFIKEGDKVWAKTLKLEHKGKTSKKLLFELDEESDGTIRLLDFVPAFYELINHNGVFLIDEIERSIHPLLIKELVRKFSLDENTKGQLIFTTHESNLLDQEIFRQDEIWFVEKDSSGSTDLYSLSDFKEHKTIDIQKGYLNGRYGSVPFLGNLKDLNWHNYDTENQSEI